MEFLVYGTYPMNMFDLILNIMIETEAKFSKFQAIEWKSGWAYVEDR